jgi:hypothetical protein
VYHSMAVMYTSRRRWSSGQGGAMLAAHRNPKHSAMQRGTREPSVPADTRQMIGINSWAPRNRFLGCALPQKVRTRSSIRGCGFIGRICPMTWPDNL